MFIILSVCLIGGIGLGYLLAQGFGCKHDWFLIDSGDITNKDRFGDIIIRGFIKVYECKKCKKLKKEAVRL